MNLEIDDEEQGILTDALDVLKMSANLVGSDQRVIDIGKLRNKVWSTGKDKSKVDAFSGGERHCCDDDNPCPYHAT